MRVLGQAVVTAFGDNIQLNLVCREYNNGRLAIQAYDTEEHGPFGMVTINIPSAQLSQDEICVKTWNENEGWVEQLLTASPSIFQDTGRRVPSGFEAPVWKVTLPT